MDRVLNFKKGGKCIVAIEPFSNASRGQNMSLENIDKWTFEGEVITIGRKYITVKFRGYDCKFSIDDDYREKYECGGANYKLYENLQELIDEERKEDLLYNIFGLKCNRNKKVNNLTLNQLERINLIIEENNN